MNVRIPRRFYYVVTDREKISQWRGERRAKRFTSPTEAARYAKRLAASNHLFDVLVQDVAPAQENALGELLQDAGLATLDDARPW